MIRWLGPAALAAAIALGIGAPAAAIAAPAVPADIDPDCELFVVPGFVSILDPSEAPDGLAPEVHAFKISCIIDKPAAAS